MNFQEFKQTYSFKFLQEMASDVIADLHDLEVAIKRTKLYQIDRGDVTGKDLLNANLIFWQCYFKFGHGRDFQVALAHLEAAQDLAKEGILFNPGVTTFQWVEITDD